MKQHFFLFILFFACMTIHAQDYQALASLQETEADEFAKKSYKRKDAYCAYLSAYRLYNKAGTQCDNNKYAVLVKTKKVVDEEKIIVNQNALFVDSLLSESFDKFKDDTETYLPLLETYIMKKGGSVDRYKRSFELYDMAIGIRKKHKLLKGKEYENILRWYANHLLYINNMPTSDKLAIYDELWKVYRDNCNDADTLDIKLLDMYYSACALKGSEETKVMLSELKLDYIVKKYGKESDEYLKMLNTLFLAYYNKSEKDEKQGVDNCYKKKYLTVKKEIWNILNMRDEIYDDKAKTNIELLVLDILSEEKDTISARGLAEDYSRKIKSKLGDDSDIYLKSLENIVHTYPMNDKALIPILEEKLKLEEKKYGKDDYRYKATEMSLSNIYSMNHMLSQAISTIHKSSENKDYNQLSIEANMQVQYGLYRDAIKTYSSIMDLCLEQPGTKYLAMLSTPMAITNCYLKIRDLKGLLEFGRKWVNHPSLTPEEQYSVFSSVMSSAGNPNIVSDEVLQFVDEYIVAHAEQTSDKEMLRRILSEKASVLYGMLRFDEAKDVIQKVLATIQPEEANYLIEKIKYSSYYEICLLAKMDWNKALETNGYIMQLFRQIPNYGLLCEYNSACVRACLYYDYLGDYTKILPLATSVMSVDRVNMTQLKTTTIDINHFFAFYCFLDKSALTKPLIHAYANEGRLKEAKDLVLNNVKDAESTIRFTLSQLDSNEKTNKYGYINTTAENLFSVAMLQHDDKELSKEAFNYCLLYKQAFMSSESLMRKQILESSDSMLVKRYTNLQQLLETRQTCLQAGLDVSAIEEQIATLDIQVKEDSKAYGDYTRELNLKWMDIQNILENEAAVVEFISYQDAVSADVRIGAVILCKEWDSPKMVSLCSEKDLEEFGQSPDHIGTLIWTHILDIIGEKYKLYFVPSGIINNIGVENAMVNGEFLSNKYVLLRLSSSRELVHKKSLIGSQAVLYGGIFYSNEEVESKTPSNRAAETEIPYLSGTKTEVETINALITQIGGIPTSMFLGHSATESSVKMLSPLSTKILHIATHGFFNPENKENVANILIVQNNNVENDMLTRSGLLLANAQETLWGDYEGNPDNDGILTSQEISTLDLRGTDMVVLSACETAKGEISSEGVFGLQRGFKKAGVNSILMSLWKVDDEATCKLMTEFYSNWIAKKMTKHDALEAAKKVVRETKGWEDPKYWAAFILLDGLD